MESLKKPVVFVLSFLLRGAALFAALTLCIMMVNNIAQLIPKVINSGKYAELKNYASVSISPTIDTSEAGMRVLDKRISDFFKATNAQVGLLFDLESQMQLYNNYDFGLISKDDLLLTDYAISVNNNYLDKNPAYDLNGNAVTADENSLEFTVLVPEKYKNSEAEILSYYTEELTALYYYTDDVEALGLQKANAIQHENLPVKIIYIKNGQRFFMYDAEYGRHLHEYIENPIIKIVTAGNLLQAQVPNYLTTKKYIVDVTDGAQQLNTALKSTGLQDFVLNITGSYEEYKSLIIKTLVTALVQLCLLVTMMLVAVLVQHKAYKKYGQKKARWLLVAWVVAIVPMLLWKNINLTVLLSSVLILIFVDIFFLRKKARLSR